MPSKTSNGKSGGTLKGKSHAKGGIKAVIVDENKPVELEGGEAIITKKAVKKHWKKLSEINQDGGGVPIVNPEKFEKGGGCGCGKMEHGGNICADEIFEKHSVNGKIKTSKGELNKTQFKKFIGF